MTKKVLRESVYFLLLSALFATIFGISGQIFSVHRLDAQEAERPTLRMAYSEFAPYSFSVANGPPQGLSIDLARRLAEAQGYALEYIAAGNPRQIMQMLVDGRADLSSFLALTPERLEVADATHPLGSFQSTLFIKAARPENSTDEFAGLRIGVVAGSAGQAATQVLPFAEIVEARDTESLILDLLAERVDAIAGPENAYTLNLRRLGIDPLVRTVEPPLQDKPYGFLVSRQSSGVLDRLNAEISSSLQSKEIEALHRIWFGAPTRQFQDDLIFWGGLALAAITFVALLTGALTWRNSKRAAILARETEQHRLLVDALEGIDAGIVIYDQDQRAVHWNHGVLRAFPTVAEMLQIGTPMYEMIAFNQRNFQQDQSESSQSPEEFAQEVCERVLKGDPSARIVRSAQGHVFQVRHFKAGHQHYASVYVEVSELYHLTKTVERQKRDLEHANEQLTQFATIAAHDLKAPLSQLDMLSGFIREDLNEAGIALPDEVNAHFELLSDISDKMRVLVDDLLAYAQIETTEAPRVSFDPNKRMANIVALVALPSGFEVKLEGDLPALNLPTASFDTVMRNLISNAVKHHDRNRGTIIVRGHHNGTLAVIEVEDDGEGIPESHLKTIFEPFKRLNAHRPGTGLGLSFVKRTVNAWGGTVSVSNGKVRGSIFQLTVPTTTAMPDPLPYRAAHGHREARIH